MDTALEKEEMLRSAGFRYHFKQMAYINRKTKKIVSIEAVEDKTGESLREMIAEPNDSGDWRFYFVGGRQPTPSVRQAFLAELE
jgi:hypothetical protein